MIQRQSLVHFWMTSQPWAVKTWIDALRRKAVIRDRFDEVQDRLAAGFFDETWKLAKEEPAQQPQTPSQGVPQQ